ncbi:MAG: AmpG family muropeptide MFS transporter [Candidatus Puniceispirillales bacterium]
MLRIFLIGAISGFPWVLIGSALSLWLKEDGLSRSAVGFAGLIFSVYAVNFLWAPLIDKIRVPFLADRVGPRKAWILTFQAVIMVCLAGWTMLDPSAQLVMVVGLGLIIAIASASQDITIDAFRIEQVDQAEREVMAAGAAMAVIGWWSGFKLGGLVTLTVADLFENQGITDYWPMTFLVVMLMMVAMNIALMFIPEKNAAPAKPAAASAEKASRIADWLKDTLVGPLLSFFRNNGVSVALALLGFIFLFKIGEAFMGKMSIIFYREIGFSKSDIGLFSKGLGWITTVVFTLVGGWFAMRSGTVRTLFLAGIAMAATNVLFSVLAWVGKSAWLFAVAVVLDDLAAAFATVAFVTFISLMVDRRYTATQYALLASIGTAGRTLLAASSGMLVDWLGGDWGLFFIITALMVTPSLVLLLLIAPRITAGQSVSPAGRDPQAG